MTDQAFKPLRLNVGRRRMEERNEKTVSVYRWAAACAAHRSGGVTARVGPEASCESDPTLRAGVLCLEAVDFASVDSCAEHFLFPGDSDGPSCRRHLEPSWKRAKAKLSKGQKIL